MSTRTARIDQDIYDKCVAYAEKEGVSVKQWINDQLARLVLPGNQLAINCEFKHALDFSKKVIDGVGGLEDFIKYEWPVMHEKDFIVASYWTLKCLANPMCEGSQSVLNHIERIREKKNKDIQQEG